jgi:hypothetical protein
MNPSFTLQQLEDQDRLSTLTGDNRPRPAEKFEGAEASVVFSLEANNDSTKSQSESQVSLLAQRWPSLCS